MDMNVMQENKQEKGELQDALKVFGTRKTAIKDCKIGIVNPLKKLIQVDGYQFKKRNGRKQSKLYDRYLCINHYDFNYHLDL